MTIIQIHTGKQPFAEVPNRRVVAHVLQGNRPQAPPESREKFPDFWNIVEKCWDDEPQSRPDSKFLVEHLPLRESIFPEEEIATLPHFTWRVIKVKQGRRPTPLSLVMDEAPSGFDISLIALCGTERLGLLYSTHHKADGQMQSRLWSTIVQHTGICMFERRLSQTLEKKWAINPLIRQGPHTNSSGSTITPQ